ANALRKSRTSSIARDQAATSETIPGDEPADNTAGKDEEQQQEQTAEHKWPILSIVGDLLIQPDERQGADWRSPEVVHAAEDRHNDHLGRFRPEDVIGEDTAVEDAVERASE